MSMLQELIAAGTPAPIRTSFVTRWNAELWRKEVQCTCGTWQRLSHDSHCHYCRLALAYVEQPVAQIVPEPKVQPVAEEMVSLDIELDPAKGTLTAMECAMATPEQIAVWQAAREAIEQDALIAELAFEADAIVDRSRYFAARSGKYVLLHLRDSGLAVNCSCGDRVKKGRFQGRCCKHMRDHNAMLALAKKAAQAA